MKALIIGATGATGKELVQVLLHDEGFNEVTIFVRRSSGITHPKLKEIITDFDKLEDVAESIQGGVLFSCLGTTLKIAGSKDKQLHIDYAIPAQFAEIAKRNGVARVVLLSAYGASATSRVFYSRVKGLLEEKMESLGFDSYIVFRPGLLLRKNSDRIGERVSAAVLKVLNFLGILRKFKPLPTAILAEKMIKASKHFGTGKHILSLHQIAKC